MRGDPGDDGGGAWWATPAAQTPAWARVVAELGLRPGEPFHPTDPGLDEQSYVAPDGTRVVFYMPAGALAPRGQARLVAIGPRGEATIAAISATMHLAARWVAPTFKRYLPRATAVCATDEGAWWIRRDADQLAFTPRDASEREPPAVVVELDAPFALAASARAVYATSCTDPRASWLVRIVDGTARRVCRLDRPMQLAVIGDRAYVACADGLVAVDAAGAHERLPLGDLPRPELLAAAGDALYWIDPARAHVVAYRGGSGRVIAHGTRFAALDADPDRAYALAGDALVAIEPRATRTLPPAEAWDHGSYGGVARVGPYLASLRETEQSWRTLVGLHWRALGFPHRGDAPAGLEAPDARAVLADWLAERGIATTPATLAAALRARDDFDGVPAELPDALGKPLATSPDRLTLYYLIGGTLARVSADDLAA